MDLFGIFGKSKKAKAMEEEHQHSKTTSVIDNLRDQVSLMDKRNTVIKKRIEASTIEAKQRLDKKDKNGALISLKKKKEYEAELEKNQGIQIVLENQIYSLESVTMQKSIVDALSQGNKSIKKLNSELIPEKIDELMDEIQVEADNFKSIQSAMSQPLQQIYNDTELLDELEQLESERLDKELSNLENSNQLPKVPTTNLPKVKTEEEEIEFELNQIKESMMTMNI